MRRDGSTTRLVDRAIQALFTEGEIHVPNIQSIKDDSYKRGPSLTPVFIDDDALKGDIVQRMLFDAILRRLQVEHRLDYRDKEFIVNKGSMRIIYR